MAAIPVQWPVSDTVPSVNVSWGPSPFTIPPFTFGGSTIRQIEAKTHDTDPRN